MPTNVTPINPPCAAPVPLAVIPVPQAGGTRYVVEHKPDLRFVRLAIVRPNDDVFRDILIDRAVLEEVIAALSAAVVRTTFPPVEWLAPTR